MRAGLPEGMGHEDGHVGEGCQEGGGMMVRDDKVNVG